MTPEQFVYWLQGYIEISNPVAINPTEVLIIKEHLQLVFDKKTTDREKLITGVAPLNPLRSYYNGAPVQMNLLQGTDTPVSC